ncbi:hypothetical protein M0R04_13830 [Candidatus Dojkabacteria bacterium]|jgi:hypothetical protein|nr:hypothetical protein [Candidatus Dojkabacteria bacterium]
MSTFINSATTGQVGTPITVNKPTDTAENDVIFAFITRRNAGTISAVPSGWTLIGNQAGDGGYAMSLYYKVAGASEPASYDWETSLSSNVKITNATFRGGFNYSNPISLVSNTQYNGVDAINRAASMTTSVVTASMIFFAGASDASATTYTKPSAPTTDWVEVYDGGDTTSDLWQEICHMTWSSSGATGDMDATMSQSLNIKGAFAIAMYPLNVTVSPSVITAILSVQAPTVTGGAIVSPTVITMTLTVQAPTTTITANKWSNTDKNSASYSNQAKNPATFSNQAKNSSNWVNEDKT